MTKDLIKEYAAVPGIAFVIFALGYACGVFMCQRHPDRYGITTEVEETMPAVTTTETTTATTVETSCMTSTTEATTMTTAVAEPVTTDLTDTMIYLGGFSATYYKGDSVPCYGGSERMLVSCYEKEDWYKGSVASRLVYQNYGYDVDGKTMVYIEFKHYPRLNGWYSVDDYNADSSIVDFYFSDYSTCPWQFDGTTPVEMWIGG